MAAASCIRWLAIPVVLAGLVLALPARNAGAEESPSQSAPPAADPAPAQTPSADGAAPDESAVKPDNTLPDDAKSPKPEEKDAADKAKGEEDAKDGESEAAAAAAAAEDPPTPPDSFVSNRGTFVQAPLTNPEDFGTGAFRRELKIDVPPFRGLEPEISLLYQSGLPLQYSGSGAGWLGIGWQLRGVPVIERGRRGGGSPSFDANDVFLLSGEELIACTAGVVSPSCSAGGTHTGRIEDYRKIVYSAGTNYWTVYAKDGTAYEFRPTSETAPVSPSDPVAVALANDYRWLLRKARDTHGNEVVFNYTCATPDDPPYCRIDTIVYGGALIKFYWETRPDPFSYASGLTSIDITHRLKTIDVQFASSRVRAYAMSYGLAAVSDLSVLASVQEFPSDASVSGTGVVTAGATAPLPATTFTYEAETTNFSNISVISNESILAFGDFNGDGKTDWLTITPPNSIYRIHYNGGSTQTLSGIGEYAGGFSAADFNGDGKDDLVFRRKSNPQLQNWSAVAMFAPNFSGLTTITQLTDEVPFSFCCTERTGDFNGDGRDDFFWTVPTKLWFGNANGSFTLFTPPSVNFSGSSTKYLDINGDGKTDAVQGNSSNGIYLSTGSGWTRLPSFNGQVATASVGDVNGDGRQDLIYCGDYRLSLGTAFSAMQNGPSPPQGCPQPDPFVLTGPPVGDFNGDGRSDFVGLDGGDAAFYYSTGAGFTFGVKKSFSQKISGTADLNGDGRSELLGINPITSETVFRSPQGAWPNLLTSTKAVLGGTTSLAYTPSSSWNTTTGTLMPFIMPTVTSVTENDGRGTTGTTTLTYRGGKWSAVERRFLGFAGALAVRPCNTGENQCPKTDVDFSQDLASVGKPTVVDGMTGSNTILRIRTETWTANNTTPPFTSLNTASVEEDRDGGVTRQKRTERVFDSYGEIWKLKELGIVGATGDERTTVTTRYPNTALYIVDKPAETSIYAGDDITGTLIARSRFRYDGAASETTLPVKGDLTTTKRWLDTTGGEVTASATYDGSGNLLSATDEVGNTTSYEYDATYHLFPVKTINPLLQETIRTYNLTCAAPATSTDPNGLVTAFTYDALCRETRRDLPGGDYRATAYVAIGDPTTQNVETTRPSAAGVIWSRIYADGFGRSCRTSDRGPAAAAIETTTAYAKRGTVASTTLPYYAGGTVYTTTFTTDALDRVTLTKLPDNAQRTTAYSAVNTGLAYDSFSVTDELSRTTRTIRDAYGRTIETVENAVTADLSTKLAWNLLDHITGIVDPATNTWAYTWDSLGRRVATADPDLGAWTFVYDDAGRLTAQTDALGQVTAFTYDGLDRVLTKVTRFGLPNAETTTNIYDQVRSGFFNIGKLTTTANAAGTILSDFDAGGRLAKQQWTVTGLAGTKTATTGYHASGQVLWKTWPDGDSTGSAGTPWTYDTAGRLLGIPSAISSTAYNAAGQVTSRRSICSRFLQLAAGCFLLVREGIQVAGAND